MCLQALARLAAAAVGAACRVVLATASQCHCLLAWGQQQGGLLPLLLLQVAAATGQQAC
jgi:hypothetical protein